MAGHIRKKEGLASMASGVPGSGTKEQPMLAEATMRDATRQDRWTVLHHDPNRTTAKGFASESWLCVDCGVNTAPGLMTRKEIDVAMLIYGEAEQRMSEDQEVYTVTEEVWQKTGLEGWGGCLCIGCLEKRIGRRLKPDDFERGHPFNVLPGTRRLLKRRRAKPHPFFMRPASR
jgi:hypothetical protein